MNEKVSVIIPAYNAANYLAVCLDRILGQTYKNIEIIIVDDGSTDGTFEVCKRFSLVDDRLVAISIEHSGVSAARNAGLAAATGDYIVFIDADDFADITLIEEYVNAYSKWSDDCAILISGMVWEDHRNRFAPTKYRVIENDDENGIEDYFLLARHQTSLLSWSKLFNFITNKCYKNEIIRENNLRFDEDISIAEDMIFNVQYLDCTKGKLGVINKPLYHYIKHGNDSLSGRYYEGAIEDIKRSYKMLLDFTCNQLGVTTDDIYVVKSIYLMDWVSRLCALWDDQTVALTKKEKLSLANEEIRGLEFRRLLRDSKMGKKITRYRFYSLALGYFGLFVYMRKIYQKLKRIKGKEDDLEVATFNSVN